MRVLVVGGGGREHALAWALTRGDPSREVFVAPGNAGTSEVATNVAVGADDVDGLARLASDLGADLTVIGPEAPLVAGLADRLVAEGRAVFGPTAAGARLEGSKVWARELCERHGIPGPRAVACRDVDAGLAALEEVGGPPFVVKADGLAGGKGVTVAATRAEAESALRAALVGGAFGDAGRTVLVEECLEGPEVSAMALTDGRAVVPLAMAQDHKRAGDGDTGPNTGGMGAYSPLPFVDGATRGLIEREVLEATVRALQEEDVPYAGVLYAGLMLTADGPKVLEFNCRFGDPETQVVLPRLATDLGGLLLACAHGELPSDGARWTEEASAGVVLASGGYPGRYGTGRPISGLAEAGAREGVHVFHAGTERRDGRVVTSGGRVLTVTALGKDLEEARDRAYGACSLIDFDGMAFRRDIAAPRMAGRT